MGRIFFLLIAGILGWFGFQYLSAVYDNVRIKDAMDSAIVKRHQEKSDLGIVDDIVTEVRGRGPFTIREKDVDVSRDDDGKGMVITASYYKTIAIPLINKKWIVKFNPTVKSRFDF